MTSLEVENKSAKPILREGLAKAQKSWISFFPFSFLLSASLDLSENRRRTDRRTRKGDGYIGQKWDISLVVGGDNDGSRNISFDFLEDRRQRKRC